MMTGEKVSLAHILPFGCLLYIATDKEQMSDSKLESKLDTKAIAKAYVGHGYLEGQKCVKGYTVDFKNKGKPPSLVHVTGQIQPSFHLEKQEKNELLLSQWEDICLERKNFNKKYHCLHHMKIGSIHQ